MNAYFIVSVAFSVYDLRAYYRLLYILFPNFLFRWLNRPSKFVHFFFFWNYTNYSAYFQHNFAKKFIKFCGFNWPVLFEIGT